MSQSKKIKVVVIGGGNGSAVCLRALKQYPQLFDISAVITMSDSNGSSGQLRRDLNALPPGDILRAVLALSPHPYTLLRRIFNQQRFNGLGKLDDHNVGNLFLAFTAEYAHNFVAAVRALEQAVEAVGRCYPVTLEPSDLCAELTNGRVVKTEGEIDIPDYDRRLKIKRAWLEPSVTVFPEAAKVIQAADCIILCPGSLYTSVVATLLPSGVKEAIASAKAKLIYVAGNAIHTNGETGPESLSGAVQALEAYLPRLVDVIVYNNSILNTEQKQHYDLKGWQQLVMDPEALPNHKLMGVDYERDSGGLSKDKLAPILKKIITADMYGN